MLPVFVLDHVMLQIAFLHRNSTISGDISVMKCTSSIFLHSLLLATAHVLKITADVNAVLTALHQETTGNLSARRARLLKTVGVLVQMI